LRSIFSKQNSLIRLKSSILDPPNFFVPPKYLVTLRHWSLDGIFASLGLEGYSSRDFSFVLQKNGFKKFLYFNDFLFVVFVGKKQTENVGKIQKFEKKNSEVMTTFQKNFGKMHKFWSLGLEIQVSSPGLEFQVSVSEFLMNSRLDYSTSLDGFPTFFEVGTPFMNIRWRSYPWFIKKRRNNTCKLS